MSGTAGGAAVVTDGDRERPTREDRAVAAWLVRRARAANSDDEVDAARDAIAREIASERHFAARSGGTQDDGLRERIEALAEASLHASTYAEWQAIGAALRRALAGPDDARQDGAG